MSEPSSKFKVVVSDPPWSYSNRGVRGAAEDHYPTMSTKDICALKVGELVDPDSVLLLWCTWPFLEDGLKVCKAWGFDYITGLPWIKLTKSEEDLWGDWHHKTQFGVGYWVRGVSEPLLICKRGKAKPPGQCFVGLLAPNIQHSRKPDNIYELAESMPGPYLEMFCRRPRDGWSQFGNEVNGSIKI